MTSTSDTLYYEAAKLMASQYGTELADCEDCLRTLADAKHEFESARPEIRELQGKDREECLAEWIDHFENLVKACQHLVNSIQNLETRLGKNPR